MIPEEQIEFRKYEIEPENFTFKVVVIDKPEKWEPASEFSSSYEMATPGDQKKIMKVTAHGVSAAEQNRIDFVHPFPVEPDYIDTSISGKKALKEAWIRDRENVVLNRQIEFFEFSTRKKIPGETLAEKRAFICQRDKGEIEALFAYISDVLTGSMDGQHAELYRLVTANVNAKEVTEMQDFGDWAIASEARAYFRMHRPFQPYIIEFPLRGVSQAQMLLIDIETGAPEPPMVAGINKATKRLDPRFMEPNLNDPQYKLAVKAAKEKRTVRLLEACLSFPIPGESDTEKHEWLSQRLWGEVVRLQRFIEQELCNYKGRFDFFTNA